MDFQSKLLHLLLIALLVEPIMILGTKHLLHGETCGGEDTCDKNKGLYCHTVTKICSCPDEAIWIKDFDELWYCRVLAGKKCGRSQTAPKCENGLYCDSVKEGDVANTICLCPQGKACSNARSGDGSGSGAESQNSMLSIFGFGLILLTIFWVF